MELFLAKGNYLKVTSTNGIILVKEIYTDSVLSSFNKIYSIKELEGIKLTENWLLKFKFKKWSRTECTYTLKNFIVHYRKRGYVGKSSDGVIHFVHELQNRYTLTRYKYLT